jgi:Na+/H+ antiporter NhaD/arsenite permease-like protein
MSNVGPMRGVVLILFGVLALYRGWMLHGGERAWIAYGLGVIAVAIGVFHIARSRSQ